MLGPTQIVTAYSVWFLRVEYDLIMSLFESGSSCPLSYLVMDGAGNKWNTGVDIMNDRFNKINRFVGKS